jgi:hypothetical protein
MSEVPLQVLLGDSLGGGAYMAANSKRLLDHTHGLTCIVERERERQREREREKDETGGRVGCLDDWTAVQ